MPVIRINKTQNYTVMSNYHFKEKDMGLKAKGLLSLMFSLPDDWDYSISGLVAICKESKTSIQSALKELEEFGYLERTRSQNSKGQFEYIYDIFEKPQTEKPRTENPCTDNQCTENMPQLNTKELNTKELNTNNIKKERKKESEIDVNFENLWKLLKAHPNDRKSKVTKKRKKELYEMGYERVEKAINLYLKIQNPEYYHKRDNILNEIIDNYIDKTEKDFNVGVEEHTASYDISEYEKQTESIPTNTNNQVDTNSKEISDYDWYEMDMKPGEDDYLSKKLAELRKKPEKAIGF